jgi:hypothetical protein
MKNLKKKKHPHSRKGWKDEQHVYFFLKNYGWVRANYCGRGTHYSERIKRGDPPINKIDELARNHDGNYLKADKLKGIIRARKIRESDKILLEEIRKIKGNFLIRLLIILCISLKISLDNLGIPLREGYIGRR